MARLRALLAMFHVVLGAFVATRLADVGAQAADGLRMFAATSNRRGRQLADRGAVHVERDAARHHFHVLLLQAGCGAMVARDGARVARFDAREVLLVGHRFLQDKIEPSSDGHDTTPRLLSAPPGTDCCPNSLRGARTGVRHSLVGKSPRRCHRLRDLRVRSPRCLGLPKPRCLSRQIRNPVKAAKKSPIKPPPTKMMLNVSWEALAILNISWAIGRAALT